ncbi:MAG: hypothetical protein ACOCTP_01940 [Roseicyclus sp.]
MAERSVTILDLLERTLEQMIGQGKDEQLMLIQKCFVYFENDYCTAGERFLSWLNACENRLLSARTNPLASETLQKGQIILEAERDLLATTGLSEEAEAIDVKFSVAVE